MTPLSPSRTSVPETLSHQKACYATELALELSSDANIDAFLAQAKWLGWSYPRKIPGPIVALFKARLEVVRGCELSESRLACTGLANAAQEDAETLGLRTRRTCATQTLEVRRQHPNGSSLFPSLVMEPTCLVTAHEVPRTCRQRRGMPVKG